MTCTNKFEQIIRGMNSVSDASIYSTIPYLLNYVIGDVALDAGSIKRSKHLKENKYLNSVLVCKGTWLFCPLVLDVPLTVKIRTGVQTHPRDEEVGGVHNHRTCVRM